MCGVNARFVEINAVLISVEADDLHALGGKRHSEGHADIAETDEGDLGLAGFDFFIKGHLFSHSVKEDSAKLKAFPPLLLPENRIDKG